MKEKQVGIVEEREAIDMTPIYYIRLEKGVRAGQTLRIDMADKKVMVVVNVSVNP